MSTVRVGQASLTMVSYCVGIVWFSPAPSCAVVQLPTNVRARTLTKTTG